MSSSSLPAGVFLLVKKIASFRHAVRRGCKSRVPGPIGQTPAWPGCRATILGFNIGYNLFTSAFRRSLLFIFCTWLTADHAQFSTFNSQHEILLGGALNLLRGSPLRGPSCFTATSQPLSSQFAATSSYFTATSWQGALFPSRRTRLSP